MLWLDFNSSVNLKFLYILLMCLWNCSNCLIRPEWCHANYPRFIKQKLVIVLRTVILHLTFSTTNCISHWIPMNSIKYLISEPERLLTYLVPTFLVSVLQTTRCLSCPVPIGDNRVLSNHLQEIQCNGLRLSYYVPCFLLIFTLIFIGM